MARFDDFSPGEPVWNAIENEFHDSVHRLIPDAGPAIVSLIDANYRCCVWNMEILEIRRGDSDPVKIADTEWKVRQVGEQRVAAKASINHMISKAHGNSFDVFVPARMWLDPIIVSVGELVDRLIIERIKAFRFFCDSRFEEQHRAARMADRVSAYLRKYCDWIRENGGYECLPEQRTYVIDGIDSVGEEPHR